MDRIILIPQRKIAKYNLNNRWLVRNGNTPWWLECKMTREQLRELARTHNIPRGRDIDDTADNLIKADLIKILNTL